MEREGDYIVMAKQEADSIDMGSGNEGKKKRKLPVIIGVIVIIVAAVVAGILLYKHFHKPEIDSSKGGIVISEDTRGNTNVQQRVAEGMITVKMTPVWTFKDGGSAGNGYVANSKSNTAPLKITVALSETGEVVLDSDPIPIGSCIENFALNKELEKGTYPAVVTHSTVDEDGNITNSVRTEITIEVEN